MKLCDSRMTHIRAQKLMAERLLYRCRDEIVDDVINRMRRHTLKANRYSLNFCAEFVRRRPGEAFLPDCTVPTVKQGGGSLKVWGRIPSSGVGELYMYNGNKEYPPIMYFNRIMHLGINHVMQHAGLMQTVLKCWMAATIAGPITYRKLAAHINVRNCKFYVC
ncbi:hypothetical protein Trydic_g20323 [Trypoxylus dichotomus]